MDRVALVTGASAGIGRAIALKLLNSGYQVAVCARREALLQEAFGAYGKQVLCLQVDLLQEAAIVGMFETIADRWGGVDVIVNNAGAGRRAPLLDGDTADWQLMLSLNVLALSVCTREAVRQMRVRGTAGHVVHVSSMAAHRVLAGSGMYSATKHAVRALTEGLRGELRDIGSAIRVTSISPGLVETEFARNYNHGSDAAAKAVYGQHKVLEATDIADLVHYVLAAPAHVQFHDILVRPTEQAG